MGRNRESGSGGEREKDRERGEGEERRRGRRRRRWRGRGRDFDEFKKIITKSLATNVLRIHRPTIFFWFCQWKYDSNQNNNPFGV